MEKNGKITKVGRLSAYCIVAILFLFDCLYYLISKKQQIFHYNKLTAFIYGEHVTFFSGVYFYAFLLFVIIPIFFFIFKEKKFRTVVLFVFSFIMHLVIGSLCVCWLESMDNDGKYDSYGDLYHYEQPDGNMILCIQEVFVSSDPEDMGHGIIYVQTGHNTLKRVRDCKVRPMEYNVSWKNDRVQILLKLMDAGKTNDKKLIDISYDELKNSGANTD